MSALREKTATNGSRFFSLYLRGHFQFYVDKTSFLSYNTSQQGEYMAYDLTKMVASAKRRLKAAINASATRHLEEMSASWQKSPAASAPLPKKE